MAEIRLHNISKLDIGMLTALQMVLAERSVGKAARRFGLSQPAMSNALARMRIAFGDPLLVRTRSTMALTARGQELLEQLETLLPQLEALARPAEFDPATTRAQFRVAATDYAALMLAPGIIRRLREEAPDASVIVSTVQNREIDIENGEEQFDLRIGWLAAPPQSWYIRKIRDDEIVVIAGTANAHLGDSLSAEQFASLGHVGIRTRQPLHHSRMDQVLLDNGVRRNIAAWMSNFAAVPFVVAQSDLIAVFPASLARLYGPIAGIRILEPPFPLEGLNISMAWPASVHHDAAHRWFRAKVVESAGGLSDQPELRTELDHRPGT